MSIAGALKQLADLAEIRGRRADSQAFAEGAARFARHSEIASPDTVPLRSCGLDPTLAAALGPLADVSLSTAVAEAVAALPRDLQRLLQVPGATTADIAALVRDTGATTLCEIGCLLDRDGCWPTSVSEGLKLELAGRASTLRSPNDRVILGRAHEVVESIASELGGASIERIEAVGSLRRFDATVGDITLLVSSRHPDDVVARIGRLGGTRLERLRAADRITIEYGRHEVTVRIVHPEAFGASMLAHTGSFAHLRSLERHAARKGRTAPMALADHAIWRGLTEAQIYERLGLPFIAPELREGAGEVEAASEDRLPDLVTRADIRGDLHMHTVWSDGRDSIETMARRARSLGYEYIAITDHSPASVGRGLDADDVRRQRDEIERTRDLVPDLTILHGIEVDILPDGALDLPDRTLARLDIVLASLHDGAGHDARLLTERYLAAMRHPLVHVVTHPANRAVGVHDGYSLDFDRLIEAAVQTGTVLEIDGAPAHLDMEGPLARRAVSGGALVAIDSDCHWSEWLDRQMTFGVATARRGWVEARHVINTRPVEELRALLERKRSRA